MMLMKKSGRLSVFRRFILVVALVASTAVVVDAQDQLTPGELLKQAMKAMEAKQWDEAIDSMYAYLGEVEDSVAPRVVKIAQDMRFKLASVLIQQERLDEAAAVLQEYIDTPLADKPRQAMKMLATCYFEAAERDDDEEQYALCASVVTNALYYDENAVVIAEVGSRKKKKDDEEDYEFAEKAMQPEEPFTQDEKNTLWMTLAESYFNMEKFEECIPAYSYVISNTLNEQRKGYAMMQVINALLEIPAFDRILDWVPQLYRTTARYDIRVNLALMNAAAALVEAEEYDSALPLYRMIMPRDELIAYQEQRLRDMRVALDLAPDEGEEMSEDEMLIFGGGDEAAVEEEVADAVDEDDKPKELREQEALLVALKDLPPYELDIQYRMADLYKTVERYWEAAKFFHTVYKADPTSEVGERCVYELVDLLLENLDQLAEAEELVLEHLSTYKEGMTPRQLAYVLTGYYQSHDMMGTITNLRPYIVEFVETNDMDIVRYDVELHFMQAVADLVIQRYPEAEEGFKYVLGKYPDSHQEANSTYWSAMTQLFQQQWTNAQPTFQRYIDKFPTEQYVDECTFQIAICMFGLEEYDAASNQFSIVIDNFPSSSVYPEACSMRADILGSEGHLDEAVVDYERAFATHTKPQQATYATFQMAEIYEAEDKYDDIIRVVERYREELKGDADQAKSLFWIGKSHIQKKEYQEAVNTYMEAIVDYGGDLRQDGVDSMISEMVKLSAIFLTGEQQDELGVSVTSAIESAHNETLELRLRVLQAKLNETEHILGRQLLSELKNFNNASPPVLATICDASFEEEDYSRSEELLTIFVNKFEDSDFMRAAYKLRGFGQYEEEDYEGVLATINDAQALYGTEHDVAWAQLLKAKVLLDMGEIDQARVENRNVWSVPSWRGVPVAQSTFQLGEVEEAAGNLHKAHAFYQRTYMQYKGHAQGKWAANGYLAAAEVLKKLGLEQEVADTYKAMLFDKYVNDLPQTEIAKEYLDKTDVDAIAAYLEAGGTSNINIAVAATLTIESSDKESDEGDADAGEPEEAGTTEPADASSTEENA